MPKGGPKKEISSFLNRSDEQGNTIIHKVAKTNNTNLAKHLICAGADVNKKNKRGDTPLALAIRADKGCMVTFLLDNGADKAILCQDQGTLLHLAVRRAKLGIVRTLLKAGVNVNTVDQYRRTPLDILLLSHWMSVDKLCGIMRVLLHAGIDPGASQTLFTPLQLAFEHKSYEVFDLLLKLKPDLNYQLNFDFLEKAIITGQRDKLELLFQLGLDFYSLKEDGSSLLHIALASKSVTIVEYLLENGAHLHVVNSKGLDPLSHALDHWYCLNAMKCASTNDDVDKAIETFVKEGYRKQMECLTLLFKRGYDVNHVTGDKAPLYIALKNFKRIHSNIVSILLKKGAAFDFEHPVVREVLDSSNGSKIPRLLLRHAALFEEQNRNDGPTNFYLSKLSTESLKEYARCRDELKLAKKKIIDLSNVSFFDVLGDQNITKVRKNKTVRSVFETQYVSNTFPIYGDLLYQRFFED